MNDKKKRALEPTLRGYYASLSLDALAFAYLDAQRTVRLAWDELFARAMSEGVRPKGAPKSRLLRGEEFEVLASRAQRLEVDQRLVRDLNQFTRSAAFDAVLVYSLRDGWDRAPLSKRERRAIARCLRRRVSRRLTVRRVPAAVRRKAAA